MRTSWTWTHWLVDSLGGLDKVVILNLDETGVPMFMGDLRGNIIFEPRVGRGHVLPTQNVPRNLTRAAVTHVGLICNRPDVQPYLPQFLLGDSSTLTVQAQREVQAAAPPNVTVWRLKSRWVDVAVMKTLLRAIGANLRANSPGLRPILIWDCCPAHLKDEVLQAARSCGIYIVLVPAKLTWLVQPLDACVFQRYKAVLRESYARIRQGTQHGIVTPAVWWRCLVEHVHVFMQSRDWSRAFEATGWIGHGVRASTFLRKQLQWDTVPALETELPEVSALQTLLPRGREATATTLRRASAKAAPRAALAPAPARDSAAGDGERPADTGTSQEWLIPRARRLLPSSLSPPPLPPPAAPPSPRSRSETRG